MIFKSLSEEEFMKKYYCLLCGVTFESDSDDPVCPVCGASGPDNIVEQKD